MSKKAVKRLEKFYIEENVTGIEKDKSTGLYRLVTQQTKRETESNVITKGPVEKSEDFYQMCDKKDSEASFSYIDIDGNESVIYFKKVLN